VNPDAVLRELDGMRALARALVHDDAQADDLLQDAAVAALEHPPAADTPVRPWLVRVLRNRRLMDVRARSRRTARELASADVLAHEHGAAAPDAIDRARAFEKLAAALVALDEPFRTTVIRRYLDGETAADIARALGVPAGTVRWRLQAGLARLRAALDETQPRWQRAFAPLAGVSLVKTKSSILVISLILLLLGAAALVLVLQGREAAAPTNAPGAGSAPGVAARVPPRTSMPPPPTPPASEPSAGQGRATIELVRGAPGAVTGRVINWSTGDGVGGAELTFTGDGGAVTVRSRDDGAFELAPGAPGRFTLAAISKDGFMPYAPELLHSTVQVEVTAERAVRGITVFLFPALDYFGRVVDAGGKPVAGARVRLLGTPTGEQVIEKLATEWTTDPDGRFTFHAPDEAVFEATRGKARGFARLDEAVAITKQLVITLGDAPARDATITGRVVDSTGKPVADVLVRAEPKERPRTPSTRSTAFATTNADGAFVLEDLDREAYTLATQAEDFAPTSLEPVTGGTRDVTLTVDAGAMLAGHVVATDDTPIPAYTLLVFRRQGARRELVLARSIVEAAGRFAVRVAEGDYELLASASGWAPSAPVAATTGERDIEIEVSTGATLRGQVVAADGSGPVAHARIMREARGGGASAQPANAGTVTRTDGTFELTGIPPGPVSITVAAGNFHPKIEAGLTATDGATLGPVTITLAKLKEGEQPSLELVGIGAKLAAEGDGLRVDGVYPQSGAADAGIVAGDLVIAVDGNSVAQLGLDGSIAKIRGVEGTTVAITLRRDGTPVVLVVTRKKLRA